MAKNKPTKIVSRKHLARQERERRQSRWIVGIAIAVLAIVFLAPAGYYLYRAVAPYVLPAVTVNGEKLTMHEFQTRVRASRQQLVSQYMQYAQLAAAFGMDLSSDSQLSQITSQIQEQLDTPSIIGSQAIDVMINDLLIRQYAQANGIAVSEADIQAAIQEGLEYYPNGTPTPTLTPAEIVYPTLNATQLALVPPTSTPTLAPTLTTSPTSTPDLTSTATPVPTNTPIPTATTIPSATPIPSLTPTATPYTQEGFNTNYKQGLQFYAKLGFSEADYRRIFYEDSLYRDRVKAKITADVTHEQDQVWMRHILVSDEATANNILIQLQNGADFAALAAQSSLDTATKDTGGDLGWLGHDTIQYGTDFADAVFSMKIGELSRPIKSVYGYHIVQLLGHEVRPLTEQEYQDAVTAAFNTWLDDLRANVSANIEINDSWTKFLPISPTIEEAVAQQNATMTAYVATYEAALPTATTTPTPTP